MHLSGHWHAFLLPLGFQIATFAVLGAHAAIPSIAQEELPVKIKADFFHYDRTTHSLTATGNVVLSMEDVTIHADSLVADLETGEVLAQGRVRLEAAGQSVDSDVLTYSLRTRSGSLINVRTDYTGPLVLGAVHLRTERLEGIPNQSGRATNAFATTCDEPNPVFYVTSGEISVFVNDKIVGHNVAVWIGGSKLFTLPYFIIFLRERVETRFTPVVGYDEVQGYFVKTSLAYFLDEHNYGFLLNDWMQRIGWGTGIEHIYNFGRGQGSVFVYRVADRQTGGVDFQTILNHSQTLVTGAQARVYMDYLNQTFAALPGVSNFFTEVDLSGTTPRSATFWSNTVSSASAGPSSTWFSRLSHSQVLSPELVGQVVTDYNYSGGVLGNSNELFPRLTLQYLGPGYTALLLTEARWDLSGMQGAINPVFSLERLPELRVTSSPIRIGETSLSGQLDAGLGRFRETTLTIVDAQRADLLASITGPIQAAGGVLGVNLFARETIYSTGDSRLFYGGRADFTLPLSDAAQTRIGYTGEALQGVSPFAFDQITSTVNAADAEVSYRASEFFLDVRSSYDFQAHQYSDLLVEALYAPRPDWTIGLAAGYNVNQGIVDRVEADLVLRLSREWEFEYIGEFNGSTGAVTHDRVSLTRIFCDCLAMSLTYDGLTQALWLETWLTALPWERGRVGIGGQGRLLFDQPLPFVSH